ncbi:CDP-alcohol phosphatidyltransferase family protein [Lysobacter korlensis]|uniref:CDP-alcohol phosphatidyltransferase family protein n=1 Tax=Lysobacter korlensis TaxID=553636 RepID=A0ABV6RZN9_9GAMM
MEGQAMGGHASRSYRDAVRRLSASQKPGAGVPAYLRWVNRGLGRHAAALAHRLGLTPNAVTAISFTASLLGMAVLIGLPAWSPAPAVAAALLLAGYALDSADGQLARLTRSGSLQGEWLDHVIDAIRLPLFHVAVAAALFMRDAPLWSVAAALGFAVLSSAWFFAQTLAEKLGSPEPTHATAPAWVSFAKLPYDVGVQYLAVLAFGVLPLFLTIYVGILAVTALIAAASLRRKYRALSRAHAARVATLEDALR